MRRFLSARAAIAAIACVSALAAAACASNAPSNDRSGAGLSGTSWRVESIAGQPVSGPTIEFAEDQLSGTSGCNRFFGGYTASDGTISVGAIGGTRMMCEPEEVMRVEAEFLAVLDAVESYRRELGSLTLTSPDGRTLVLRPS